MFADDAGEPSGIPDWSQVACGFYWTEGKRGLGWAVDAIPPLKGGSTLGIPSPPAIWFPFEGRVVPPDIRDTERLQGFPANWTAPAVEDTKQRNGPRWRLVGNAVSLPLAKWVGERLRLPASFNRSERHLLHGERWPLAAWGTNQRVFAVDVSTWPVKYPSEHLRDFLRYEPRSLSARATAGFLRRAHSGQLRFVDGFLEDVKAYADGLL